MEHVFVNHGLPHRVLSDRGGQFIGNFNQALAKRLKISWDLTTAYKPSTDGQTERVNRVVEQMLRHYVSPAMNDWDKCLGMAQFAINNAWHESVQETPFFLNYGRHPRTVMTVGLPDKEKGKAAATKNPASGEFLHQMQNLLARAQKCICAAQQRQKRYYDMHHKFQEHGIGEQVLLSTKNLNIKTTGTPKLWPRWVGPFTVTDRRGAVAYQLDLPGNMHQINDVFHVGLLRKYKNNGAIQPPPVLDLINNEFEYTVDTILGHRVVKRGKQRKIEYLVHWLGYGEEHNTFEPAANLINDDEEVQEYWLKQPPQDRLVAAGQPTQGLYYSAILRQTDTS